MANGSSWHLDVFFGLQFLCLVTGLTGQQQIATRNEIKQSAVTILGSPLSQTHPDLQRSPNA